MMDKRRIIPVMYIGDNKGGYLDRLYRTGVFWPKQGDIQFLSRDESIKMLRHIDLFRIPTEEEMQARNERTSDPLTDAVENVVAAREEEVDRVNKAKVAKMDLSDALKNEIDAIADKEELLSFAARQPEIAGMSLDRRKTVENLKAEIIETMTLSGTLL